MNSVSNSSSEKATTTATVIGGGSPATAAKNAALNSQVALTIKTTNKSAGILMLKFMSSCVQASLKDD